MIEIPFNNRMNFLKFLYSMNNRQSAFAKGNNNFTTMLIGIIAVVSFTSCFSVRNTPYFNTIKSDTTIKSLVSNNYESIIQKKDVLNITVSSLNNELDNKFNEAGSTNTTNNNTNQIQSKAGFLVGDDGTVELHYLGSIRAEGLTRKQLKEKLQTDLLPYMKEPIVNVQFLNKKVTVLGEVGKPQILQLTEEQTPLLEVLVNSGDVTKSADKKKITIIRENGSQKKVKQVNLEDHAYFSSPWYYVQPNDIVLVGIDKRKYLTEEKRKNLQTTLSLIASLVSLALIVINLIFKI